MIKFSEFLIVEQALAEVLSKDADSSEWIADFVKSDNPKFKGKSKAERIKMALGAYYAKQRNEEVELDDEEAERKAKLKAALAATDHVAKGGMQKKGYTGSTYNPQKKVQKEELELDEALKPGDKVTYETSKYSKDNKGVVHSVDGEHVTIKGHDMLGKPHHIEIHQGFVKKIKESFELDEENLHRVIGQVYSDDDQKWYHQSYTTRAKSKEHAVQKAKEQFGKRGQKFRNVEHDAEMHESVELDEGQKVKTATGYVHKGSYGSDYDTDEEGTEKKKAAPEVKRSRGRPKKGSDETGEVKKYTFHDLLNRLSR